MTKVILAATSLAILTLFIAPSARADDVDPPTRVARVSYLQGEVSVQPGDSDDWSWASVNRPLTTGDKLWTQDNARAEVRIGSTALRADQQTSLSLLNLDDRSVQLGVNSGSVIIHVKHIPDGGFFEVDTPNAAITLQQPGDYRVNADDSGDFTSLTVTKGLAEVDGSQDAFKVDAGSHAEISGTDRLHYDLYDVPATDAFDRWSRTRDWRSANARSARYVSPELTGYEDLDSSGTWVSDPTYGNVWQPQNVAADWTPYRDGHWAWIQPWGWTWLDDSPWGFATSHYGRWASLSSGQWVWVPPQRETGYSWPVYSPANVVFLSNSGYVNPDGPVISWIPLAPGEIYYPGYNCSRSYWTRLNTPYVHGHWGDHDHDHGGGWHDRNNDHWNDQWAHREESPRAFRNAVIAGAVVAVAADIFSNSRHVGHSTVRIDQQTLLSRHIAAAAPVAPVKASTLAPPDNSKNTGAAPQPPRQVRDRQVVARQAPPPRPIPFERQQRLLEKNGGQPLDAATEKTLRPDHAAPMPAVRTVTPPAKVTPAEAVVKEHGQPPEHTPGRIAGPGRGPDDRAVPAATPTATPAETPREQAQKQRELDRQNAQQQRQQQEDQRKAQQQQDQDQRKADQQKAYQQRQQQQDQRKADQQQADQQRQQEQDQRKADQQKADQQRQQQDQRKADQQQADQQRQQQENQRKVDQQQADQQQQQQREEERQKAEQQRQQQEEQKKAEQQQADQQRQLQQQQREQERQQQEEQKKAEQQQAEQQRQLEQQQAEQQRQQQEEQKKAEQQQAEQQRQLEQQQAEQQRQQQEDLKKAQQQQADQQRALEQAQKKAAQEQARQKKLEEQRLREQQNATPPAVTPDATPAPADQPVDDQQGHHH